MAVDLDLMGMGVPPESVLRLKKRNVRTPKQVPSGREPGDAAANDDDMRTPTRLVRDLRHRRQAYWSLEP